MYTFAQKAKTTQQNTSSKSMMTSRSHFGQSRIVDSNLQLQRTIGNQSLQRLVQSDAEERNAVLNDISSHNAGHSFNFANTPVLAPKPISVQPKLTFGQANEKYEQELDSKETVRGGGTDKTAIMQPSEPSGPQDIVYNSDLPDREQAMAMTLDRTIYVSPDALHLPKPEFNRLIAHESVHVAQQNLSGRPGTRSALEHEANKLAPLAIAGRPFHPQLPASPRTALRAEWTIGTGAADQKKWVSRVDNLVRKRFRLTRLSTRMTHRGRVKFQSTATYARGFGRKPVDLLVEAFVGVRGDLPHLIGNFYGFEYAIMDTRKFVKKYMSSGFQYWKYNTLPWSAWGLISNYPNPFTHFKRVYGKPKLAKATLATLATRAQAQAAAQRQPGIVYELTDPKFGWPKNPKEVTPVSFHIYVPLSRVTKRVSAGEILAEAFAGVTSGGRRGRRRIRIKSDPARPAKPAAGKRPATPAVPARPANISTLVHEACHFYTHNNFNRFAESVRKAGTEHYTLSKKGISYGVRLAPVLAEGFTEYFTRMLMREHTATLGPVGAGAYQSEYEAAHLIIDNMIPPSAAETAYFHGRAADIRKVRLGIFVVENSHELIRKLRSIDMAIKLYEKKIKLLEEYIKVLRAPARRTPPRRNRKQIRTP